MINRRGLLTTAASTALAAPAWAQQTCFDRFNRCFGNVPTASGPYVGPGDLLAGATAWYGLRGYTVAAALSGTQKAINIRRASDNATTDILILPTGKLDVATATTFLAATTGFVTTWYDQSGNGFHATQATAANQPQLTLVNGAKNLPCLTFAGAQFLTTATTNLNQPFSMIAIGARDASFTTFQMFIAGGSEIETFSSANNWSMYAGARTAVAATDGVVHSAIAVFNGASPNSMLNIDGSVATLSPSTGAVNTVAIGAQPAGTFPLSGRMVETALYASAISAGNQTLLQANQRAYWGTS